MDDTKQAPLRRFHLTPGRFALALLGVEVLLWLNVTVGFILVER
jgi:hypothetical protein